MKKIVLLLMIFVLLTPNVFGENRNKYVKPEFILIMTDQPGWKSEKDVDLFDCRSKVYAELILLKVSDKRHKIEAFWFGPGTFNQKREYTEYEFEGNHAYVWLGFNPSFGGVLLGGINPSFGMDNFIGQWKVKIHLDGKFLESKTFYVAC